MNDNFEIALITASTAIISGLITAFGSHMLQLSRIKREQRFKEKQDKQEKLLQKVEELYVLIDQRC